MEREARGPHALMAPVGAIAAIVVAVAAVAGCGGGEKQGDTSQVKRSLAFNKGEAPRNEGEEQREPDGEGALHESEQLSGPAQQQVDQRAYPRLYVSDARARAGRAAYRKLSIADGSGGDPALPGSWEELGPVTPTVLAQTTYTGRATTNSGRVTALAVDPNCDPGGTGTGACRLWSAAAGGGIWRTTNALADKPTWKPVDAGLPTDAVGSLVVDPTVPSGDTLYAGTGEPNGSSDSEAGLGLYKSTDGGDHWALVPGSFPVAHDRSIASIAIDPGDPDHILIATSLARHGSSSSNGGRRTPPNAPPMGVYETTDGGQHFSLAFTKAADPTDPASGNDFFIGSANRVQFDPEYNASTAATPQHDSVYAALQGYGIWRRSRVLDADADWHQVFQTKFPTTDPAYEGGTGERTEFDLTVKAGKTRIYAGDSSDDFPDPSLADFAYYYSGLWRTDNADRPANQLVAAGATTAAWQDLSGAGSGDHQRQTITNASAFSSQDFCQTQCSYDNPVAVDPSNPDTVVLGGQMRYNELPGIPQLEPRRSNGRTVIRSTNSGLSFTDMTNDTRSPPEGLHPDNHAIAFDPHNTKVFFIGSDGGVSRTNGVFADRQTDCNSRTDTNGAPLAANDLAFCKLVLSSIPERLISLNDGLATLQFQSVTANPTNPTGDLLGGTQDNGTWSFTGTPNWIESIGGDGGQSGIDAGGVTRVHSYFGPTMDVNFQGNDPNSWYFMSEPMFDAFNNGDEAFSFYTPLAVDHRNSGTLFTGGEYVWRTKDWGGLATKADRDAACKESAIAIGDGTGNPSTCGNWTHVGQKVAPNVGNYIVATELAPGDSNTLWVGLRRGGVFVSKNAAADRAAVSFADATGGQPTRFVSSIHVDPADANHAWISYSGYSAYTPDTPGHVFEATFHPDTGKADYAVLDHDLPDMPITDLARDDATGDLYAATDYGVLRLANADTHWERAAAGLPLVAVYGLTIDAGSRTLNAATHGRGIWRVTLPQPTGPGGGGGGGGGAVPGAKPKVGKPKVKVRRLRNGRRRVTITVAVSDIDLLRIKLSNQVHRALANRTFRLKRATNSVRVVVNVSKKKVTRIVRRTRWHVFVVGRGGGKRITRSKAFHP